MTRRTLQRSEVLWAVALLVVIIAVTFLAIRRTDNGKEDCEAHGGTVIDVHNSQYGEWFCQEARP